MFSGLQSREESCGGSQNGWSGEGHQPSLSSITRDFKPSTGIMTLPGPLVKGSRPGSSNPEVSRNPLTLRAKRGGSVLCVSLGSSV